MTTTLTPEQLAEARTMGVDAAKAAASWTCDGNTDPAHARRVLAMLDAGDPEADDFLPQQPNLSGEWADDMTPIDLARYVLGGETDDPDVLGELADAYETGVSETFEAACEAELRKLA